MWRELKCTFLSSDGDLARTYSDVERKKIVLH